LQDCHRYYVTGFTGSMAECLVPASGRAKLFVDGRYHEQADLEVDGDVVEVVKCKKPNTAEVLDAIKSAGYNKVALEGARTTLEFYKQLEKASALHVLGREVESLLDKPQALTL